jgi:hypothetical protein
MRLGCKTPWVLQEYAGRWSCEVANFYFETHLSLADFRVRLYEACDNHVVAAHLAWAYIERRFVLERGAKIKAYGDLFIRNRVERAAATLKSPLLTFSLGA